jgi:hypothetical protein
MLANECLAQIIAPLGKDLIFLEVGVLQATNLVELAKSCPNVSKFIGVDNYESYTDPLHGNYTVYKNASLLNLAKAKDKIQSSPYRDKIELIVEDSHTACDKFADESLDIVFLDKSFTYEIYRQDILDWLPKVKIGGVLSGHEWNTQQAAKSVKETLYKYDILNINEEVWYVFKSI